jgi:hypothetical protein
MRVGDLQQHFRDLAKLLSATDAKKAATEITKIADGLQPFHSYDLGDFVSFLARAEEYHRTGVIPSGASKPAARSKSPAKPNPELAALRSEILHLHDSTSSPGVDLDRLQALEPKLGALSKDALLSIADTIGLVGMKSKLKAQILGAIVNRIKSIKHSSIRTAISDRPGSTY